jgi:4-aminobutyrate aminotransferase-like enzyme
VVDVSPVTAQSQGGAPVACTAALAVLEIVREEQLAERAADLGAQVMTQLQALQARYPVIGDVRGRGLLIGVELVTDRRTREPAPEAAARLVRGALERGLLVTSTGRYQNVIEITPPLTIDVEELDRGLLVFEQALRATDV